MKDDYRYEAETERFRYLPIDNMIDDYPTRICKSYYQILQIMDNMDEYLIRAGEYPVQLSKDHAERAQNFLEEVGEALQKYESLFNEMDE